MDVKAFPFLAAIGIQQGGIQIEEHKFRILDGIDDLPHCCVDLFELGESIIIHSVPEAGQSRLGCQLVLIEDGCHHGIVCQLIGTVILEVS